MIDAAPALNPFEVRGAIRDPKLFFGRKREIKEILDLLEKMLSVSVVGERLIGKSSLLRHLVKTAGPRRFQEKGYQFIYLDMERIFSAEEFFERACAEIARNSGGTVVAESTGPAPAYDRRQFERMLSGKKVVLCLDEFEQVTENPDFDEEFFNVLRSLAQEGNLALVLATKHWLRDLYRGGDGLTSPFYNIFTYLALGPMTEDEAIEMIRNPLRLSGVEFSESDEKLILDLAGTHPYRLNLACALLYDAKLSGQSSLKELRDRFNEKIKEIAPPQPEEAQERGAQPVTPAFVTPRPSPAKPDGLSQILRISSIVLTLFGSIIGWLGVQLNIGWGVGVALVCFVIVVLMLLTDLTGLKRWSSGNP